MIETLRNLTAYRLARSSRRKGFMGTLARLGLSRSVGSGRGFTGTLARAQRGYRTAQLGMGALLGTALVAAGVVAARRRLTSRHEPVGTPGK